MNTQRNRLVRLAFTAALTGALLVATPVLAQAASNDSKTTQTSFTDKQLKQFVSAQQNVQEAIQTWDPKVAAADEDKRADVQEEENKALAKAVTSSGLKPDTYNAIATSAQQDPDLTRRIQSFMEPQ